MPTSQLLPPPYAGQNDQYPLISIQNPYCEFMHNYNNLNGVVKVRQGNEKFAEITGPLQPLNIATYGDKLFALVDVVGAPGEFKWYDITSGTPSEVHSNAATGDDEINTLYFNGYLFYFGEFSLTTPEYYNGTTWGSATYSFPGSFKPFGGDVFKNRAYILGYFSTKYVYTGIDEVSGATVEKDLAGVISEPGYLFMIRPISLTQNLTPDAVQAFIFSTGEILVYQGTYPDSPTWGLVSRFTISQVPYLHYYIEAKGDSFILTESEILSLRNLYISGYDYERDFGIGRRIKNRWTQIITKLKADNTHQLVHGIYDKANDRLVISLPRWIDPETGVSTKYPAQLIYDFTLQAWYEYYQQTDEGPAEGGDYIAYSTTYFEDSVYVFGLERNDVKGVALKLEAKDNFMDEDVDTGSDVSIPYDVVTAPLPISKFGANAISGIEAICLSDLYPQTNYKLIADLGRQETEAQVLPAQGTGVAKPMMNVGIQGAVTVQLQISGNTVDSELGLELYGFNVWYSPGDAGSR